MPYDPITGPLPREKLRELVDAPYGEATQVLRQYDPEWGLKPGQKIEWEVVVERDVTGLGVAHVMAGSLKEAEKLTDDLCNSDIDWDDDGFQDFVVKSVKPVRKRVRT